MKHIKICKPKLDEIEKSNTQKIQVLSDDRRKAQRAALAENGMGCVPTGNIIDFIKQ